MVTKVKRNNATTLTRRYLPALAPFPDGVILYRDDELHREVWIRMRDAADGRSEVDEIYLPSAEGSIGGAIVRRIPFARIEAFANDPSNAKRLHEHAHRRLSLEEHATKQARSDKTFVQNAEMMLDITTSGSIDKKTRTVDRRRLSVRVPSHKPFPPTFYEKIAGLYREVVANDPHPAASIATASNVPVTTVHAWIKECRQRGLLPAGRPGKAG